MRWGIDNNSRKVEHLEVSKGNKGKKGLGRRQTGEEKKEQLGGCSFS
jgi:hypothetical protein